MSELYRLVRDSELFDAPWYRRQSPATRFFPTPILHYALVGWKAGKNPSPRFDTQFYWDSHRDVRQLGANPLVHYLLHGRKEGRLATTTGKAVRAAHTPSLTPLPLFSAPPTNRQRLTVVIDDHTPRVIGLGLTPVVALATAVARRHDWMLRFIIRSDSITRADIADATPTALPRPHTDVVVRSPGPCPDVECVDGELWWATSATARVSLAGFVPSELLWWVISANEIDRHPAGELRLTVTSQLASKSLRALFLHPSLEKAMSPAGHSHVIDSLPRLTQITAQATNPPLIGVIADEGVPENLFRSSLKLIEEALATAVIDPAVWQVALFGSQTRPVTLTGSVTPRLSFPATAAAWQHEVAACTVLVILGAGSEPGYLAHQAIAAGITTVFSDSTQPVGNHLGGALAEAIAGATTQSLPALTPVADVAASLDHLWGSGR